MRVAETRLVGARVPEELEKRARAGAPELADLDSSMLVRTGLAMLAGDDLQAALQAARDARQKRGYPSRKPAAA